MTVIVWRMFINLNYENCYLIKTFNQSLTK